jgi:streptogramin lyase
VQPNSTWRSLTLVALCSLAIAVLGATAAGADPVTVSEFPLAVGNFYPRSIAVDPAGNAWFTDEKGQTGQSVGAQHFGTVIDRITSDGQVSEFVPPARHSWAITAGPLGSMWYLSEGHVGQLTQAGQFAEYAVGGSSPQDIVAGPDGNLWIVERNDTASDSVVRMTPTGETTSYVLPNRESGPQSITVGPEGSLWFTEYFGKRIGRITTSGQITEFPIAQTPLGLTTGPDGNLWFPYGSGVGRMTPSGEVTEFKVDALGPIATGPDGRLWFLMGLGKLGRITTDGRTSVVKLPNSESSPSDIAPGPQGLMWYTAAGDPPCEGGGGTCLAYTPRHPGIVGKIAPSPVSARPTTGRLRTPHRQARIPIACEGGDSASVCRGKVRLVRRVESGSPDARRRVIVGQGTFRLRTDEQRLCTVRLGRRAAGILGRNRRLRAQIIVSMPGTKNVNRGLILYRGR